MPQRPDEHAASLTTPAAPAGEPRDRRSRPPSPTSRPTTPPPAPGRCSAPPAHGPVGAVPGYEILDELGRGGMGVVYKARHVALDRVVALKMILLGAHAGPKDLARFRAEAEAVARLPAPEHRPDLRGRRARRAAVLLAGVRRRRQPGDRRSPATPRPPRERPRLVETLARAMHYAHERGIVHRDLKPANSCSTADGTPKITDFGLAKRLDDDSGRTQTGQVLGTPELHGPGAGRRATSSQVGPATDVYALGAILYDLLTGRPPFPGRACSTRWRWSARREPVPPRQPDRPAAARPGNDLPEVPAEGPGQAVRDGRRPGRRPAAVPRRPADPGPPGRGRRAGLAVGEAEPGGGRPRVGRRRCCSSPWPCHLIAIVQPGGQEEGGGGERPQRGSGPSGRPRRWRRRPWPREGAAAGRSSRPVQAAEQRKLALDTVRDVLLRVDERMKPNVRLVPIRLDIIRQMLDNVDRSATTPGRTRWRTGPRPWPTTGSARSTSGTTGSRTRSSG